VILIGIALCGLLLLALIGTRVGHARRQRMPTCDERSRCTGVRRTLIALDASVAPDVHRKAALVSASSSIHPLMKAPRADRCHGRDHGRGKTH